MELVVIIVAPFVLAALARHFGVDSRDNVRWSHEAEFAARGSVREQQVLPQRDPRAL